MTLRVGCMEQGVGGGRAVVAAGPTSHGHPLGEDGDGALGHLLQVQHRGDLGAPAVRAHPEEVASLVGLPCRLQHTPVGTRTSPAQPCLPTGSLPWPHLPYPGLIPDPLAASAWILHPDPQESGAHSHPSTHAWTPRPPGPCCPDPHLPTGPRLPFTHTASLYLPVPWVHSCLLAQCGLPDPFLPLGLPLSPPRPCLFPSGWTCTMSDSGPQKHICLSPVL